ncbi:tetratricopeptide repeat protein [Bacteriovorax sp. BSW11_IV]|uniref:tetratricopeptide repeat protein n=1 Tax=Bacteriovorax sp. BSW11_IV TaxID=1353529 RepID=UPI00038A004E|nr:tetratricopeptide repeat protein [Bacteriovorax sp. BSW11_IV]EQC50331.1 tetratricopeptide repeat protein [Bacteriovorax sp. BSW11_IV]
MNKIMNLAILMTISTLFASCGAVDFLEQRAAYYNQLEDKGYVLLKENEALKIEVAKLKTQVKSLESKNYYLDSQLETLKSSKTMPAERTIASVAPMNSANDLVKFDVYKWKADEMLAVAGKEFTAKNFEKSAQFYNTFAIQYPDSKLKDDKYLYQAAMASYESGKHYDWTLKHLDNLVANYPKSEFFLGAKLWMGLTYLKIGDEQKFFSTVEEFRLKYRNTPEWRILSPHYEKIVQKYKTN